MIHEDDTYKKQGQNRYENIDWVHVIDGHLILMGQLSVEVLQLKVQPIIYLVIR
jgi:hypothetical protein